MAVINKIKKGADKYDIQDPNAATKTELQALETTVSGKQNALTETQLAAVNSGIDSTKVGQIATNASDINTIEGKIPSAATAQNQLADKTYVDTADNGLQSQIDAISASSDVKDIVGTKAELNNYDTSTLGDNDIIKVLQDESENDATTYYRWSTSTNTFTLIGEEGPYYTKSQANALLDDKVDKVTGKGLSENDFTTTLKDKLDGIEAGAEVNEIDSISVNGTPVTPDVNKNVALTIDDGIKTLTTEDYNYPVANPDRVALNYLPAGIYKISKSLFVHPGNGATDFTQNNQKEGLAIVIPWSGSSTTDKRGTVLYTAAGGELKIIYGPTEGTGSAAAGQKGSLLSSGQIVNTLTSTSTAVPLSAAQGKYLNDNKADKTAFTGTDGTSAGAMGLVPAPVTTDAGKFLKADGTWATPDAGINTLTTEDYNYPETGTATAIDLRKLPSGVYKTRLDGELKFYSGASKPGTVTLYAGSLLIQDSLSDGTTLDTSYVTLALGHGEGIKKIRRDQPVSYLSVEDVLNSTSTYTSLSANQGRVLNEKIEGRLKTNAGAPTTSTTGTLGQLLLDTTNAKLYQLTAIDTTDPSNPSYTWSEVGGSSVNVVQTTGTSTTDVMSQNAVTGMIYADPSTRSLVRIGGGSTSATGVQAMAIGHNTVASGTASTAVGRLAYATSAQAIAIGNNAKANHDNSIAFSGATTTVKGEFAIAQGSNGGYNNSNYRLLTGLYDPQSAHDAATKGYVDSHSASAFTTNEWNALWS